MVNDALQEINDSLEDLESRMLYGEENIKCVHEESETFRREADREYK